MLCKISDEHGGMERLSNFLKGTQLVNGQAGFKPDSIASEIQFFNIISILYIPHMYIVSNYQVRQKIKCNKSTHRTKQKKAELIKS